MQVVVGKYHSLCYSTHKQPVFHVRMHMFGLGLGLGSVNPQPHVDHVCGVREDMQPGSTLAWLHVLPHSPSEVVLGWSVGLASNMAHMSHDMFDVM